MSKRPRENKPSGRQGSSFSGVFAAAFEEAAKRDQGLNVEQYKKMIAPEEHAGSHDASERKPEQSQESGASSTPKSEAPQRSIKPAPLTAKVSQARKKTPTRQASATKKPASKPSVNSSSSSRKTKQGPGSPNKRAQKPSSATPSRQPSKKSPTHRDVTRSKIKPELKGRGIHPVSTSAEPGSPLGNMKKSGFKARKPFSVSALNEYGRAIDEDHHPKWQPPVIKDRHSHKGTSSARHRGSSGPSGMPIDFRDDTFIRWDDE